MKVTVNGTEYDSFEDVPAEQQALLRAAMPDTDGDGVADAFEGDGAAGSHTFHATSISSNGQTYASLDDVPEPLRSRLRASAAGTGQPTSGRVAPIVSDPQAEYQDPPTIGGEDDLPSPISEPKRHWWQRH